MSEMTGKNIQIYAVLAIVTGSGIFYSSSNVGITDDKVDALEDRITKLEEAKSGLRAADAEHNALFAHAGIKSLVDQQGQQITRNHDDLKWVERCVITGPCK
ncbi:MAG: hypothetical protein OES34_06685 [Nitrosopumilus sp.]|nr:hypothetical protein [Nitrosopumilus sp.]